LLQEGRKVEVFGTKGSGIDGRKVGITLLDAMLLDELQVLPPSSGSLLSCYSLAYPEKRSRESASTCLRLTMFVMISCERFQHRYNP
jgi:hypothetical protein